MKQLSDAIGGKLGCIFFSKVSAPGLQTCASIYLDGQAGQFAEFKYRFIIEDKTEFHAKQVQN